jgi:hypothetical protein
MVAVAQRLYGGLDVTAGVRKSGWPMPIDDVAALRDQRVGARQHREAFSSPMRSKAEIVRSMASPHPH